MSSEKIHADAVWYGRALTIVGFLGTVLIANLRVAPAEVTPRLALALFVLHVACVVGPILWIEGVRGRIPPRPALNVPVVHLASEYANGVASRPRVARRTVPTPRMACRAMRVPAAAVRS